MLYIPPPLENCNTDLLDAGGHGGLPAVQQQRLSISLGKNNGPKNGDLAPLTLLDILPDRDPTSTKPLNSWRSLGEIKDGIISRLSALQATET